MSIYQSFGCACSELGDLKPRAWDNGEAQAYVAKAIHDWPGDRASLLVKMRTDCAYFTREARRYAAYNSGPNFVKRTRLEAAAQKVCDGADVLAYMLQTFGTQVGNEATADLPAVNERGLGELANAATWNGLNAATAGWAPTGVDNNGAASIGLAKHVRGFQTLLGLATPAGPGALDAATFAELQRQSGFAQTDAERLQVISWLTAHVRPIAVGSSASSPPGAGGDQSDATSTPVWPFVAIAGLGLLLMSKKRKRR